MLMIMPGTEGLTDCMSTPLAVVTYTPHDYLD